jgi:hypothetical protein
VVRTHQLFAIAPLILCFVSAQASAAIVDDGPQSSQAPSTTPSVETAPTPPNRMRLTIPDDSFTADVLIVPGATDIWRPPVPSTTLASSTFGQRGFRGRGRRDNDGARAAIILGAVATIAGTAVLVYANRPDCNTNPTAGGCGYGTKVVGGAVLSAGVVSLLVGALTWR